MNPKYKCHYARYPARRKPTKDAVHPVTKLDAIQMELAQAEREHDEVRVLSLYQQKTEIQNRKLALAATSSES